MKCLKYDTKNAAQDEINSIEARVPHDPEWKYSEPRELIAGGWIVEIVDSILPFLTPDEIAAQVDFDWSEVVVPEPIPGGQP